MRLKRHTYTDWCGNCWSVRMESSGSRSSVAFISKGLRLVAAGIDSDATDLTLSRLKQLFCDADRVLEDRGLRWRVGYRRRTGMSDRTQPGMNTWFTSERGEVRYIRGLLQFRTMAHRTLCEHLRMALRVVGDRAKVPSQRSDW